MSQCTPWASALEGAGQGRLGGLQRLQAGEDVVQGGGVEAGADLASVAQRVAALIVQGQQQGAETVAAAFWVGVTDDHELLALLALELDPVATAPADIGAVGALADQPLELQTAGAVEQRVDRLREI